VSRFKLVAIDAWWLWVMESLDDYEIDDEESVSKLVRIGVRIGVKA